MARVLLPGVYRIGLVALGLGLVVVAGAVAAGCYFADHVRTAYEGPTQVKLEDIAKLEDPRHLPSTWVDVTFDKAVKSSFVVESRPTNGGISHVSEEFLMFQAGERWMIAAVPRWAAGTMSPPGSATAPTPISLKISPVMPGGERYFIRLKSAVVAIGEGLRLFGL